MTRRAAIQTRQAAYLPSKCEGDGDGVGTPDDGMWVAGSKGGKYHF